jgi:hypothetical protein
MKINQINTTIKPKEITKDIDTGVEYASFDYYDGISLAKQLAWKQTTNMRDLDNKGYFIVCCGDVMIRVVPVDYPEIERRVF